VRKRGGSLNFQYLHARSSRAVTSIRRSQMNNIHTHGEPILATPAECLYSPRFLNQPAPSNPAQAASLRIARGRFPVPTVLVGGRRMVRVEDIHKYIASLASVPEPVRQETIAANVPERRGRGRPSNSEIEVRRAAKVFAARGGAA
jgi:hypothetical protein